MKVQFKQWTCIAQGNRYGNGHRAIRLIDEVDGEPVATCTTNLPGFDLDKDVVFVKDYSENNGMVEALLMAGIINPTVEFTVESQFVNISAYKLTLEAINNLW